jgi:hypothetical protein
MLIRRSGNIAFDVSQAADFELEWWIVHREHARHTEMDLGRACAAAAAALYAVPPQKALEHGLLRARAMLLRDAQEDTHTLDQSTWVSVESLLHLSYQSLYRAVSIPASAAFASPTSAPFARMTGRLELALLQGDLFGSGISGL